MLRIYILPVVIGLLLIIAGVMVFPMFPVLGGIEVLVGGGALMLGFQKIDPTGV